MSSRSYHETTASHGCTIHIAQCIKLQMHECIGCGPWQCRYGREIHPNICPVLVIWILAVERKRCTYLGRNYIQGERSPAKSTQLQVYSQPDTISLSTTLAAILMDLVLLNDSPLSAHCRLWGIIVKPNSSYLMVWRYTLGCILPAREVSVW